MVDLVDHRFGRRAGPISRNIDGGLKEKGEKNIFMRGDLPRQLSLSFFYVIRRDSLAKKNFL